MTNLEGCGGCLFGASKGMDCTALPNVEDVDCQMGACVISEQALQLLLPQIRYGLIALAPVPSHHRILFSRIHLSPTKWDVCVWTIELVVCVSG